MMLTESSRRRQKGDPGGGLTKKKKKKTIGENCVKSTNRAPKGGKARYQKALPSASTKREIKEGGKLQTTNAVRKEKQPFILKKGLRNWHKQT